MPIKFSIEFQLKALPWIYAAAFVLFVILGAQMLSFFRVMIASEEKATHSRSVIKANNDAKNLFLEAETKGRYASFDQKARAEFPKLAAAAIEAVTELPTIVGDNDVQIANADHIIESVKARFETQGKTIAAAQLVNGTLQSNPALVLNGVDAQANVINAFITFEAEEQNLSLQRYEAFWSSLWAIGARGAISFTLLVITSFLGGSWTWRTLIKSWRAIRELGNGKSNEKLETANKDLSAENESLKASMTRASAMLDS